jgi:hypothetical protein
VLLSGPIGDWKDYLQQLLWSGLSSVSGHKFGPSAGLDRFPGWLVLLAGWGCIAHGLGGARKPPSDATGFARMRFQLRWLPLPILATLGTYVALAYHGTAPLLVTIDVINAPPGVTVHGGPIVGNFARRWSRYGATFDYLFGVPLPPFNVRPVFYNQIHSEFRFPAGRMSLQNWQPDLERVFLGLEDERQAKSALVSIRVQHDIETTGTISVSRASLGRCHSIEYGTDGACWIQVTPHSVDDREIRVVFDLAGVELQPYGDAPYFNVDLLWGPDP